MAAAGDPLKVVEHPEQKDAQGIVRKSASNELFFGVVGHVGSGTSQIAEALRDILQEQKGLTSAYEVEILKARDVIRAWASESAKTLPGDDDRSLDATQILQDYGDEMRARKTDAGERDYPAIARGLVRRIQQLRAEKQKVAFSKGDRVYPDGERRAYILDSLRHPAEVHLLRHVYQDAFVLIGVVCEERKRLERIMRKYEDAGDARARDFMERDASAGIPHGQHVADTFHMSDFFLDNTVDRELENGDSNPDWNVNEELSRLVKIVSHSEIVRPTIAETAMHHAYGAMMRSACISRQVGAALVDSEGNVVATGTNEVPQAGGGVYGESPDAPVSDERCAFRTNDKRRVCSNTREQNELIDDLMSRVGELQRVAAERKEEIRGLLRKSRIGGLLEFSRAVHAEMDAILSSARIGGPVVGTRLFVTTFPCHYCARHLVTAGVDEVQYIEPYPKSHALDLHEDSIQTTVSGWEPPSRGGKKVLFRPFFGVAPRMYRRAFMKDRSLKEDATGNLKIGDPPWGTPWHLSRISYVELEVEVAEEKP